MGSEIWFVVRYLCHALARIIIICLELFFLIASYSYKFVRHYIDRYLNNFSKIINQNSQDVKQVSTI